ncbi:MAG: hypothetical protein ACRC4M_02655 [Mycoplasma sp.]
MKRLLKESHFIQNKWLKKCRKELREDFLNIGINFYDWYSNYCSSCGVHFEDDEGDSYIAFKIYKGGMNSQWDRKEKSFEKFDELYLTHCFDHKKDKEVYDILSKYFEVELKNPDKIEFDESQCISIKPKKM